VEVLGKLTVSVPPWPAIDGSTKVHVWLSGEVWIWYAEA
jgi:hypothetical protein